MFRQTSTVHTSAGFRFLVIIVEISSEQSSVHKLKQQYISSKRNPGSNTSIFWHKLVHLSSLLYIISIYAPNYYNYYCLALFTILILKNELIIIFYYLLVL